MEANGKNSKLKISSSSSDLKLDTIENKLSVKSSGAMTDGKLCKHLSVNILSSHTNNF